MLDMPLLVARVHDGKMVAARHYLASEVGVALAYIESIKRAGDGAVVTCMPRDTGLGVSETDARKLQRATKGR